MINNFNLGIVGIEIYYVLHFFINDLKKEIVVFLIYN